MCFLCSGLRGGGVWERGAGVEAGRGGGGGGSWMVVGGWPLVLSRAKTEEKSVATRRREGVENNILRDVGGVGESSQE